MKSQRGSSKSYLAIQLLTVPPATFFAAVFNTSTLQRFQAAFPGYPRVVYIGTFTPPDHLRFLHDIGPAGIVGFAILTTIVMLVFSFVGRPKTANVVNFILLVCLLLFFLGVFVSYTIGLLGLTYFIRLQD